MKLVVRGNGYYYIYYGRLRKRSLKTKDVVEARKLFNLEKDLILQGKVVEFERVKNIRLLEFMEDYLKARVLDVKPETIDNDELAFKKFVGLLGDMALRQVDRQKVDEFKAKCLKLGFSKSYINILLRCLRAGFNVALEDSYISDNPFLKKKGKPSVLFKVDEEIPRFLYEYEIQALLSAIGDDDFGLAVIIFLYTGLRRSEVTRLKVSDIDFVNNKIYVRGTKGKKDEVVPICDELMAILRERINFEIGPVFGRWQNPDTFSRLFKKYARKAGLGDKRLHDLRHTFGSYLALKGADIEIIKKLMRHKDIRTTEIYVKLRDETLRSAVNKLKFAANMQSGGL